MAGVAFGGAPPAESGGGDVEGFVVSGVDVVGGLGAGCWELHEGPLWFLGE